MADQQNVMSRISRQFDSCYEFDRDVVTPDKLHSNGKFASLFAGEHVAGTEFVIGPFFVLHGISVPDLFWGLLIGNLLAVLSWAFVCAPIAVKVRLTLYWYLRKIAGPGLSSVYNLLNGLLYCIIAGAMIAVSATAIGLAFNLPRLELDAFLPNSVSWVVIVFITGSVVTLVAILGFEKLTQFSKICVPWIFMVFIAGSIALLPSFGPIHSFGDLWTIANEKIWTGVPTPGVEKFGVWHIIFFAWFVNLAHHIDLSDMATLRYAKTWKVGFLSALGMFPGHMLAWICSGIMVAAVAREMNPGLMAYAAAGLTGAAAVIIAGWTTANPTMYRAGLALQSVTPNWARWKVTLAAGMFTTAVACFPAAFMRLLDFVALYGLILMPMGAVVFAEHWLIPKIGLEQFRCEKRGFTVNVPAALTWVITLAFCWAIPLHLYFKFLPGWFVAVGVYMFGAWLESRNTSAAV